MGAMFDDSRLGPDQLHFLNESELREFVAWLLARFKHDAHEIDSRDAKIEKPAYEVADLRRLRFGTSSEQFNAQ